MNDQRCKVIPEFVDVNSDEPVFFFYLVLKQVHAVIVVIISMICMVSCEFQMINMKVFNLMPRANETRSIEWHETCKLKYRPYVNVFNNKVEWR